MSQADASSITTLATGGLVTSRRNFFTRAFGLTIAGATVAVPVVALASPEDRIRHHAEGLEAAIRDAYPGAYVSHVAGPIGICPQAPTNGCWVFSVDVGR